MSGPCEKVQVSWPATTRQMMWETLAQMEGLWTGDSAMDFVGSAHEVALQAMGLARP